MAITPTTPAVMPVRADARTREHLEWIAEDVISADGTPIMWQARPAAAAQERELARGMADARSSEYRALIQAAATAAGEPGSPARALAVRRLRAQLRQIERRDYFPPPERRAVRTAVNALLTTLNQEDSA